MSVRLTVSEGNGQVGVGVHFACHSLSYFSFPGGSVGDGGGGALYNSNYWREIIHLCI